MPWAVNKQAITVLQLLHLAFVFSFAQKPVRAWLRTVMFIAFLQQTLERDQQCVCALVCYYKIQAFYSLWSVCLKFIINQNKPFHKILIFNLILISSSLYWTYREVEIRKSKYIIVYIYNNLDMSTTQAVIPTEG